MLCNCAIDADNQINIGATRQSSNTGVKELEEDKECDAFTCIISQSDEDFPTWIGCDCGRWYHLYCVDLKEACDSFLCAFCKQ